MKKDHLAESTIKVTDRRLRLIAKTASISEEALKLLEAGFEYATDMDGMRLFRNRK